MFYSILSLTWVSFKTAYFEVNDSYFEVIDSWLNGKLDNFIHNKFPCCLGHDILD